MSERGRSWSLCARCYLPVEQAQLAALPDAEKQDRALSLWTLKESYIKARGLGLLIPLDKIIVRV